MTRRAFGALAISILGSLVTILLWEQRARIDDWEALTGQFWYVVLILHFSACVLGAGRAILDFGGTRTLPKWHVVTVQLLRFLFTILPLTGDRLPWRIEISLSCTALFFSFILRQWYIEAGFESLRKRAIDVVARSVRFAAEAAILHLRNPPQELTKVFFVWLLGLILLSVVALNVLTLRAVREDPALETPTTLLISPVPTTLKPSTSDSQSTTHAQTTVTTERIEPGIERGSGALPLLYEEVCAWAAPKGHLVYPGEGFPQPAGEMLDYSLVFSQQGGAAPAGCPLAPARCSDHASGIICIQEQISDAGTTRSYYTYSGWCDPGLVLSPLSEDLGKMYREGALVAACPRSTVRGGNVQVLIDSERVGVAVRIRRRGPYVLLWEAAAAGWAEVVAEYGWVWPLPPTSTGDASLDWSFVDQSGTAIPAQMTSSESQDIAWVFDRAVTAPSAPTAMIDALQRLSNEK